MKKTFLALGAFFITLLSYAQYDEAYTKINTMLNPDNSMAKTLKKEQFKELMVTGYEPDAEDTAETVFTQMLKKYDAEGRVVYINIYPAGAENETPFSAYTYGTKGEVVKYAETHSGKESGFTFEYLPKNKGIKSIQYSGPKNYKWNEGMNALVATTELDTQYFYFTGMQLTKYVRVFREKEYAKGFFYTDTTYYSYDKKGNLIGYASYEINKFGDTTASETGAYTYNKDKMLTKAVIKKYDSDHRINNPVTNVPVPRTEEEYTYAFAKKSGRMVSYSYVKKNNYMYGDEIATDNFFVDEGYTYTNEGLLIKASRSVSPGVVTAFLYEYKK